MVDEPFDSMGYPLEIKILLLLLLLLRYLVAPIKELQPKLLGSREPFKRNF